MSAWPGQTDVYCDHCSWQGVALTKTLKAFLKSPCPACSAFGRLHERKPLPVRRGDPIPHDPRRRPTRGDPMAIYDADPDGGLDGDAHWGGADDPSHGFYPEPGVCNADE